MGLLEMIAGADSPAAKWAGQNRNWLGAVGQSIAGGFRPVDYGAASARDQQQAQEAEKANRTKTWLSQAFPDIAAQVDAGLPIEQGFFLALQQMGPKSAPEPIKLGAGEVLYDPVTKQPIFTAPTADKPAYDPSKAFQYESDLAKEYRGGADVKAYQDVRNAYERVRTSASQDNGAGDIGLIYGYMKMLDPGSVVREGEFATAETASGVPANILNLYNKLINGERLNPDQRKMFVEAASGLYQQSAGNLSTYNSQFQPRLDAWKVDPGRVLVSPEAYAPLGGPPPAAAAPPAGPPAAPSPADPLGIL